MTSTGSENDLIYSRCEDDSILLEFDDESSLHLSETVEKSEDDFQSWNAPAHFEHFTWGDDKYMYSSQGQNEDLKCPIPQDKQSGLCSQSSPSHPEIDPTFFTNYVDPIRSPSFNIFSPNAGVQITTSRNNRFQPSCIDKSSPVASNLLSDVRQEIKDLSSYLMSLQEQSESQQQDDSSRRAFDVNLEQLEMKTTEITAAFHRNYLRTKVLQEENDELLGRVKELEDTIARHNIQNNRILKATDENSISPSTERQDSMHILLKNLDRSDDYVKRQFPPILKTPGTMFVTELTEFMELQVGEHAYLADIMDRHWSTD